MNRVVINWHNDCLIEAAGPLEAVPDVPTARALIVQRATGVMGWHVEETERDGALIFSEGCQTLAHVVVAPCPDEPLLSQAQNEVAAMLAEELAEAGQCASKLIRFGVGVNPWTGVWNSAALASELGDVLAIVALAEKHGLVDLGEVSAARDRKIRALQSNDGRLRYASPRGIR